MSTSRASLVLALLLTVAFLVSCTATPGEFVIASGSENRILEPIVQRHCKEKGITCHFVYEGSLDIGLALREQQVAPYDAVWPASSAWIDVFDERRQVEHLASISQTPVVLAVSKPDADSLGWTAKPDGVSMNEILAAVKSGKLTYGMTSATQSNSGAMAYLSMLAAANGGGVLDEAALAKEEVRTTVRDLLTGMSRSAGSSSWLADLVVETAGTPNPVRAMWNYEAVVAETNAKLAAKGSDPLWAVYPTEGAGIADSPLGFVADRLTDADAETKREAFFESLQGFLLSEPTQREIGATGRRLPLGGVTTAAADPNWNFDPSRPVTGTRLPEPKVIYAALDLYQTTLRRPSLTGLCLDKSGSMQGAGIETLHDAVKFVMTPAMAASRLVQWTAEDKVILLPFDSHPGTPLVADGTEDGQRRLLDLGVSLEAGGGTDMYACGTEMVEAMKPYLAGNKYLPAIIMMTDGQSDGDRDGFLRLLEAKAPGVPVFGITFGDADRSQLDALAAQTNGNVFDGTKDLTGAFRSARGYN